MLLDGLEWDKNLSGATKILDIRCVWKRNMICYLHSMLHGANDSHPYLYHHIDMILLFSPVGDSLSFYHEHLLNIF